MDIKPLYYECHVTVEPVKGERLQQLNDLAEFCGFRVANLIMLKDETPNQKDAFCSARNKNLSIVTDLMFTFVGKLQKEGFTTYRYKLEATLFDTKGVK